MITMTKPQISIVIPAFNCEKTIAGTLESVLALDFPEDKEVIVVDDGSQDRTPDIIKSFPSVKYIRQDNAGPAAARNFGARETAADIIFFTDADCSPHPDWIQKMLPFFRESKIAVVAGSYGISNPSNPLAWCIHKEIMFRHEFLMPKYPKAFGSYNFAIRKKVFEEVGGFNPEYRHASGEDNDLSYKILAAGYRICFEKEALVDHYHPSRLHKYLFEQYRHGFWRVKMYLQHPAMSAGDDYTFWKDIMEVLFVVFFLLELILVFWNPAFLGFIIFVITSLILLEIIFSILIVRNISKSIYFTYVLFLRSFTRTFGFIVGVIKFAPKKFCKSV